MAASIRVSHIQYSYPGLEENFQQPDVQTNCTNQIPTHSRKKASGFLTSGLFPRILDCLFSLLPEIKMSPVCPKYTRRSFLTKELEKAWGFPYPLFGDYANFKFREQGGTALQGEKVSDPVSKIQSFRNPIWTSAEPNWTMASLPFAEIPDGSAVCTPWSDKILRTHEWPEGWLGDQGRGFLLLQGPEFVPQ